MTEPLVVRPSARKLLPIVLGALGFVIVGVYLVTIGEVLAGLAAIVFFGGGTGIVLAKAMRHGMSQLTLAPDGLHVHGAGTVAWDGIEAVGHSPGSGGMVWIRLRDPERFAAPATTNRALRRLMLPFAAFFGVRGHGPLWRYATRVRSYADELRWNREHYGWDLAFAVVWLDRSGDEFVALLERYRRPG